jgi:hypothetical protein
MQFEVNNEWKMQYRFKNIYIYISSGLLAHNIICETMIFNIYSWCCLKVWTKIVFLLEMTSNAKLIEQKSNPNPQETHYCNNSICLVELIVLVCPIKITKKVNLIQSRKIKKCGGNL